MIKATYISKGREVRLERVGEHCSPHLICTLFGVGVRREGEHRVTVYRNGELIGILRFDEVGYGIPVKSKKET